MRALPISQCLLGFCGGGGGIRTHGRLSPTSVFKHEELRVSELAVKLERTEPQISEACKTLSNEGYIYRDDRTQPYRLVKLLL